MALTKSDAIKRLLAAVGESTSLTSGTQAYDLASLILDNITIEVLGLGWNFNTTYGTDGSITSITTNTPFDNVPEHIQAYILARAIHEFSVDYTGENIFSQDFLANIQQAYVNARNRDMQERMPGVTYSVLYSQIEAELKAEFNVTSLDDLMKSYADMKAKRLLALYTRLDGINYLQPSQEEQTLYQRIAKHHYETQLSITSYDDILQAIRIQLINEEGWWFNTVYNSDGGRELNAPVTLPALVEEYAKAKAKRIFTAYTTNNLDLLINPTPEEQELYQKMLEANVINQTKAKGLDSIKQDLLIELLNEGWSFNTFIDTYANLKASYPDKIIRVLRVVDNYSIKPLLTTDTSGNQIIIDKETKAELDSDTKLEVLVHLDEVELPGDVKAYLDMKAMRLFKYYNDPKYSLQYSQATAEEMQRYWRLRAIYDENDTNNNLLDTMDYDWYY